jgi:hypothetical protein
MSQYQQKIDIREFATPQDSSPLAPAADGADFTIRLWRRRRPDAAPLNWQSESVLIYMIVDLIVASSGRIDESSTMTAHFDSSGRALVAAKRVQTAILEFLACRSGDYLGAAVLVHSPVSKSDASSKEMIRGALRSAQPAQILLAEEISNRLRGIPGVDIREVPALATGGNEHAGLSELLWIMPGRIAELKASADAARREEDSSAGATMMVNAPFAGKTKAGQGKTPTIRATGETSREVGAESGAAHSRSGNLWTNDENSLHPEQEQSERHPFFTRPTTLLGLAAVILVGVLTWVFYPAHTPHPPAQVQENPTAANGPSQQTPQTTTQPAIVQSPIQETQSNQSPVVQTTPLKPAKRRQIERKADGATANSRHSSAGIRGHDAERRSPTSAICQV